MSAYKHALAIDSHASEERLARAAGVLAGCKGVVMFEGALALYPTHSNILCEVIDPTPSTHRCADEYAVLVENAKRALEASKLRALLPGLPLKWSVVADAGKSTVELWRAPEEPT